MAVPKRPWFTVAEVAQLWGVPLEDVEYWLVRGALAASIRLPTTSLRFTEYDYAPPEAVRDGHPEIEGITDYLLTGSGIFEIQDYGRIQWTKGSCDLKDAGISLWQGTKSRGLSRVGSGASYGLILPLTICKADIFITVESVNEFQERHHDLPRQIMPKEEKVSKPSVKETAEEWKRATRPPTPDRTGWRGPLRTIIEDGLIDFHADRGHWPREGKAFTSFLSFIHNRFKIKPPYLATCKAVDKDGDPSIIVVEKGKAKSYTRKYVEDQFHKIKAKIIPK